MVFVADAALMMQLGCDGGTCIGVPFRSTPLLKYAALFSRRRSAVFVGSGIFHVRSASNLFHPLQPYHPFQSGDPAKRARAIVQAVTHFNNPKILAEVRRIILSSCQCS